MEDDLEYIQSGAKTHSFGKPLMEDGKSMCSDEELRIIDQYKVNYIPEGYYLEDMIDLLKLAISNEELPLIDKVDMVLQNIDKYTDNKNVSYREKYKYHERIFTELFTKKELHKIHLIDTYTKNIHNENTYQTCIYVNIPNGMDEVIYLYSNDENKYKTISINELAKKVKDGLVLKEGIPGLNKVLKNMEDLEI